MSVFCSCLSRRRSDNVDRLFHEQLERVRVAFPGTDYVCLLHTETGDMIAQTEVPAVNTEDLARTIITLKRSALQFASTLNQMDSQVIHIKGDELMFSCYGNDQTILAFYTRMTGMDMEFFDCSDVDKTVEGVHAELNRVAYANNAMRRAARQSHS
ncbi:hypothetical protein PINS_up013126 [Pythium insidiosum]|nr:hypothetical protein PINS_up013126 [Pythium insidiosum]